MMAGRLRVSQYLCAVLLPLLLTAPPQPATTPPAASHPVFTDVTAAARLTWGITRIARGEANLVETMGGGGGFVDFDGDGRLDIYFVSYSMEPQGPDRRMPRDALYRNNGDGTFTDVTASAGVTSTGRGMGLATGDYDNDGDADLYVSGHGAARLYRNDGGKVLTDVTAAAGVSSNRWGTSAAFFDFDGDGDLDLFVANYLDFVPLAPGTSPSGAGARADRFPCQLIRDTPFCSIDRFRGSASSLFRNNGDGTFADVSARSGIGGSVGKGLGVVAADFDGDGWVDVFQANDTAPNFLFRNRGDGTFVEIGLDAGVAYDPSGRARGAMGADAGDVDGDGRLDVFVTNFTHQGNTLFHNQGDLTFQDVAARFDLARVSLPMSGFGARFFDYDNDADEDLMVANGHPFEPVAEVWPGITWAEPVFLFERVGATYREVARERGAALARPAPGRGLATGDYDNDGDADVLLLTAGEPPRLLRNDGGNRRAWIGVQLIGKTTARDAVGAEVLVTAGGVTQRRAIAGGTSYCAASDRRLLFGLGEASRVERLEVRWPRGRADIMRDVAVGRYITIREGS